MEYTWLLIVIVLAIIEICTVNLVTIWFIASGLITLILSIFIDDVLIQVAIFTIIGIILLITTRKKLVQLVNKEQTKTNIDRVIGKTGIVTSKITKNKPGEVKADGKTWTAIANETIEKDKIVKILEIEGVKIKVEKE